MWAFDTVFLPLILFGCVGITAVWFTNGRTFHGATKTDESKITARGKISWTQIMASAWIHGTGAWVLFAPPETGWSAGVWGVVAYAVGCGLPGMIFAFFGSSIAKITRGFSFVDWIHARYNKAVYYIVLTLSLFFLFILSCSELTGLLDAYDFLLNSSIVYDEPVANSIAWIPAVVVIIANSYACIGGLEVSLITDRCEGVMGAIFLAMCIWICSDLGAETTEPISWEMTTEGRNAIFTLILGCWINEMVNQTQWQRVFSARSPRHLRTGAIIGSCLIMTQVACFGMCGVLVHQLFLEGKMPSQFDPDLGGVDSLFWGLFMANNSDALIKFTLAITCCIVCSTMDTLVNAYASMLIKPLQRADISLKWTPLFTLLFTVPAIAVASVRLSVISLFMTINILAICIVPAVFWGVFKGYSSGPAVLASTFLGISVVPIYGGILEGSWSGSWNQFLFPRGPYDTSSAIVFVVCALISAIGTPIFAQIHKLISPIQFELEWSNYISTIPDSIFLDSIASFEYKSYGKQTYTSSSFEDDELQQAEVGEYVRAN